MYCYFRLNASNAPTHHKTNSGGRNVGLTLQIVGSALTIIVSLVTLASYILRERNSQPAKNRDSVELSQTIPDWKQTLKKSHVLVATQKPEEQPAAQRPYPDSKAQNGASVRSSQPVGAPNNRDNSPAPQVNTSLIAGVVMAPPGSQLCLLKGTPFLENIDGTISYIPKTSKWIRVDDVLRKCPAASNSMNISAFGTNAREIIKPSASS